MQTILSTSAKWCGHNSAGKDKKMKLYRVNRSEVEELYSMKEKIEVARLDAIDDGRYPDADAYEARLEEVEKLIEKAGYPGAQVDWPTLKRIREIKAERQAYRYGVCLAAGMSEQKAAYAFAD